ncbi:2-C-methyl-D-erythritol 4-phosphate cytidylyltransferase [Nocardioides albertanoniae]|uniref:2-C-methyl-D-erythritol 4-phosphate cytidylyltransferase n=1 Tax=Nocardioides albertanoniae TaxID=1175486 RepID=A0A543A361_9ACTN|nr:2-C-methyl-D-erythritol 4-phosphate cytidylyltransferase [Nocardioides albertanoniae]TQL67022.1 2-C-methyl-D-erythritol 4-phosphate cytidylyltransferase [Nocardioides albertanoniae]
MEDIYADYDEIDETVEVPPALGIVADDGRGSLPFALIHDEALVAAATWALGESGVTPVDFTTSWEGIVAAEEPLVLHDSLCPMTPPAFIAHCLSTAVERDAVVIGVRPVTDTVKTISISEGAAELGRTIDRSELISIASPIVLPPAVVATLEQWPSGDFATIAASLASRVPVISVEAPPVGRRVASEEDVRLLEALSRAAVS